MLSKKYVCATKEDMLAFMCCEIEVPKWDELAAQSEDRGIL